MNRLGRNVTFSIIGANCEGFLNDIFAHKIRIYGVRNENGVIYAETRRSDYPKIAKLSRKYVVRVRTVRKGRRNIFVTAFRKRPGLVIGTFLSLAVVMTLRLFVWKIDIHGNTSLTDKYMLDTLEQYGFTAGVVANDTDATDAERRILMSSDKINWINIEINGSRADVYLTEENSDEAPDIDFKTPCNIVADRSAVLVDADVSSGKLMYEKGSGVAEGSIIVSGAVSSGNALILVHSDAEIIGEFFDEAEFSMNFVSKEKIPSGNSCKCRQLMLLGMVFPIDKLPENTRNTVCTEQTEECRIFGIPLPVRIKTDTYTEYKEVDVTRKTDDVKRLLEGQLEMYIFNFFKDYELLDTQKEFTADENGAVLKARIKLRGNIGKKQVIYEH